MAFITLSGTLLDPNGDLAVGDQIRFTHNSTTGQTVQSAASIITVNPSGTYSLPLQYGLVLVEYKDVKNHQFKNLGVATVNATNTATSIPELLNALVPVSSAELIEFQAILADCVTAQNAAEDAADISEAFANQLTTTDLISSASIYAANVVLDTSGFTTSGDGGSGQWKQNGVTGQTLSQTPAQLADGLLNDGNGNQWSLIFGKTLIVEKLGGLVALQAALNANPAEIAWFTASYDIPANTTYLVKSNTIVHGHGIAASVLSINALHAADTPIFKQFESSPDGERTPKNITIKGFTIDGSAWQGYDPWLSNLAGDAITNPEFDYSGAGIIGGGGDIFDVVAADRRNPNYNKKYACISMNKVTNPTIESVKFINNSGFGVMDLGCLSMTVKHCEFINHGRIDDISSAIWTQSFGTPGAGQSFYMPSENHITRNCYFECKRSAITLSPAKGGKFYDNIVKFSGESAVFSGGLATADGGSIRVFRNTFGPSVVTDIVCAHVESNGNDNYHIYDNDCSESDMHSINTTAGFNVNIYNNTFTNNVAVVGKTIPYGPFSERYSLNIGTTPIAGNALDRTAIILTGSYASAGAKNHNYNSNVFIDTRVSSPALGIVGLTKGGTNLSNDINISNNNRTQVIDTSIPLVQTATAVMNEEMAITTKDNVGDITESPVTILKQIAIGDTSAFTITPGFRPSRIDVYASSNNAFDGTGSVSTVFWKRGSRGDYGLTVGPVVGGIAEDTVKIRDSVGNNTCLVEFSSWNIDGAIFSVVTATKLTNVRFICYP